MSVSVFYALYYTLLMTVFSSAFSYIYIDIALPWRVFLGCPACGLYFTCIPHVSYIQCISPRIALVLVSRVTLYRLYIYQFCSRSTISRCTLYPTVVSSCIRTYLAVSSCISTISPYPTAARKRDMARNTLKVQRRA